jgi:FMN phosphatase YigB (HAD superfamily)
MHMGTLGRLIEEGGDGPGGDRVGDQGVDEAGSGGPHDGLRLVDADGDPEELNQLARSQFQVPAASMYPDARPTLAALATRYKIGVVANPSERPAKQAGLHTIWLLRGEAPPSPTVEQLAEADAIVTTFSGVPDGLVAISPSRTPATTA